MIKAVALGCVVVFAACGDDGGSERPVTPRVLTRTEPASQADCPLGGTVVLAGADQNGNGVLDFTEVATRTAVCSATPEAPVLVRLVAEPRGAACGEGGTAVQSGPDRNGNGVLDADEVEHTDFVCGRALVTRVVPEPEGANCAAGGVAFQIGTDTDGDGVLDDDEVARTEYECGNAITRNVTISEKAELAALAHIRTIHGSLTISSPSQTGDEAFDEVALPELRIVRDALAIRDVKFLTRIDLPALELVGLLQIADNSLLATATMPALLRVAIDFDLSRNPRLAALIGPRHVTGDVFVRDNVAMTTVALPFDIGGRLEVSGNAGLTSLAMLVSDTTRQIRIVDNGMPQLTVTAVGSGALADLEVLDNPALTRVTVRSKRPAGLHITGNPNLDTVNAFADQIAGEVVLASPRLAQVGLRTLQPGSLAITGALTIAGPISTLVTAPLVIGSDLTLEGTQLTAVATEANQLQAIGGALRLRSNAVLASWATHVPVGGGLEVVGNPLLVHADFFAQDTIDGDVVIADNAALAGVEALQAATTVHGSVAIRNNAAMPSTLAGAARIDGALEVTGNPALTALGFAPLARVGGAITISNNAALPAIALAELAVTGPLHVEDNAALGHLTLPALLISDSLAVRRNHALPACEVTAVFAHVRASVKEQIENDDAASCAP